MREKKKNFEKVVLQPFCWRCIECAIHRKPDVCEEHPYMCCKQAIIE